MPHQVIIRYCPDTVRGEFVNIGVAVYDIAENVVISAFIDNEVRLADFFELGYYQSRKILDNLLAESAIWTVAFLAIACEASYGSVVFSEPKGTILDLHSALADAASRYLHLTKVPT